MMALAATLQDLKPPLRVMQESLKTRTLPLHCDSLCVAPLRVSDFQLLAALTVYATSVSTSFVGITSNHISSSVSSTYFTCVDDLDL